VLQVGRMYEVILTKAGMYVGSYSSWNNKFIVLCVSGRTASRIGPRHGIHNTATNTHVDKQTTLPELAFFDQKVFLFFAMYFGGEYR
jgi:hypothetical protein